MKFVIAISAGSDDPTRASLGLIAAKVAAEQGHEVIIWVQGEGVYLAHQQIYPVLQGVNVPPAKDVMNALLQRGVPLWVCEACAKGRAVGPDNWVQTASYKSMGDYIGAVAQADRCLCF